MLSKSVQPDYITGIIDGDRPDDRPNLRKYFKATNLHVLEGGKRNVFLKVKSIIEQEKCPEPSSLLHPILKAFERAQEEGKTSLLVFAPTWGDDFPVIRALDSHDGDPYVFYQDLSKRLEYKNLVMALSLNETFQDQFPMHLYETIEKWDCLHATPVITPSVFPVSIVWGKHTPLQLPLYRPHAIQPQQ